MSHLVIRTRAGLLNKPAPRDAGGAIAKPREPFEVTPNVDWEA